jgi:nicotinamidase-related amidase
VKQALLAVDLNNDHIYHDKPFNADRLRRKIPNFVEAIERARAAQIPIAYVTCAHPPNDALFSLGVCEPHAIKGSEGAEIIDEVKPKADEYVVEKRRFSGFYGTDLDLYLRELAVESVILIGGQTHTSIRYTAVDAYQLRYRPMILRDCVDSCTQEFNDRTLDELFFCKISRLCEIAWPSRA